MTFHPDDLLARLEQLEAAAGRPLRYVIAFSGGLDSTVLAHVLAKQRARHGKALLAVHVDHRLQADSRTWARHCERVANKLDIDIRRVAVEVDPYCGLGPEAAAREARYAVFRQHVSAGDWLLCAHHRDDQAETTLMNLLRGSGPAGVAGIPELRKFADGWLARPLLQVPRKSLETYASANGLEWIDDPSNAAIEYDRNFLRNSVLPLLESRWPNVASRLVRSAGLARECTAILNELADDDLGSLGDRVDRLDTRALGRLSAERARNALRRAISRAGLPPVPASRLQSILTDVLPARSDALPVVKWAGAEARRYRDSLYLLPEVPAPEFDGVLLGTRAVGLGTGMGRLVLEAGDGPGLSDDCIRAGLTLRARQGGEEIRPAGQRHTRKLKKLLQEEGVVPWMRDRVPLIYSGERLVAVADLWLDDDAALHGGAAVRWADRPALR